MLKKVNLIASAVETPKPPVFGVDVNEQWVVEEVLRKDLPTEKRILVDEVYKILYFNNADPDTVILFY